MSIPTRPALVIVITSSLLLAGCSNSARQTDDDACDSVKTGVIQLSSLMTEGVSAALNGDSDTAGDYGREMRQQSAETADTLANSAVEQAFTGVHSAFDALADELIATTADDGIASRIEETTNAVQAASTDLIVLCGETENDPSATAHLSTKPNSTAVSSTTGHVQLTSDVEPDSTGTADFRPTLSPGKETVVAVKALDRRYRSESGGAESYTLATAKVSLSRAESSVFTPASWGKDWRITLKSDPLINYVFTDESGDTYSIFIFASDPDGHTLYFNSDKPNLVSMKASKL